MNQWCSKTKKRYIPSVKCNTLFKQKLIKRKQYIIPELKKNRRIKNFYIMKRKCIPYTIWNTLLTRYFRQINRKLNMCVYIYIYICFKPILRTNTWQGRMQRSYGPIDITLLFLARYIFVLFITCSSTSLWEYFTYTKTSVLSDLFWC